ncbi:hypothetical protein BX661DRAFT_194151 [Kickxella alabastrina]|uniref:uncharacterized protein n=1 Tax=Kickxella alabastrina TaxID=61397 RepID=UPI00221F50E1|nr:uncharacterized protein BX661DRAFT_194151 [Kickxella alabastrina]KAI7825417.1 hypothetical protein BX661DRAFT_194151 [Kickxella alabastrina]
MVRHSKNNTASGVFTYAERQMVDYGTKSKRLGSDTKRRFDSCHLCLNTARSPMTCTKGHVSCKECVLNNILEQKQSIELAKKEYALFMKREDEAKRGKRKEEDEREVQKYLKREVGLGSGEQSESRNARRSRIKHKDEAESGIQPEAQEEGKNAKPRLTSFWVPSMAPETKLSMADPSSRTVQCHASLPHSLKLKSLVAVQFRSDAKGNKLCPSCDKELLNSSKVDVLRPCGHALCHRCVGNFVEPTGVCFVCQAGDVIRLDSEGTGFSAAGGQMVATRMAAPCRREVRLRYE